MQVKKEFTISQSTEELLAIYRDFNKISMRIYEYFHNLCSENLHPDSLFSPDEIADERFVPYSKSLSDVRRRLLEEIGTRIEWALSDGEDSEI